MLLISKSISQLLLPPGGLIILGALGLFYWQKRWGRGLVALSLVLFWLLSIAPVRDMLTGSLEMQYAPLNIEHIEGEDIAIVVLGGGIQENSLDYQGRDELSRYAMMRAIYAANIAKQTPFEIYATGGTPLTQDAEAEGDIMKRRLIWFGIDEARVHAENKANTTWENAVLTQSLLAKKHISTVILVTSAWHMPRSVWCFASQGLRVIPAPTDYLTQQESYDLRSFLPRWTTFSESGHALHEYLGLLWYQLKYSEQAAQYGIEH